MKDEIHSKNPSDKISDTAPEYPAHYDISKDETAAGKADARREAYECDGKQDSKAMPDL